MKPSLSWDEQVALLKARGLIVEDEPACARFLAASNYYRFSGYARYFQRAPHLGDNRFVQGATFAEIRSVYDADEALRLELARPLARIELVLRSHVAHVIAHEHGPYKHFLNEKFYSDIGNRETTVDSCLRDIRRSKDRHILHFRDGDDADASFQGLPIWSAVEAWSFGTLSKAIERGNRGLLANSVAENMGVAGGGFAYRVKSLVYLRNRCAHHGRLWNHSVVDAGPTPNNVRSKAKRLVGQFGHRSVLDVIASLDDMTKRAAVGKPVLEWLVSSHGMAKPFIHGLASPEGSRDRVTNERAGHRDTGVHPHQPPATRSR